MKSNELVKACHSIKQTFLSNNVSILVAVVKGLYSPGLEQANWHLMHDKVIKSELLSVSKHLENLTIDWKL